MWDLVYWRYGNIRLFFPKKPSTEIKLYRYTVYRYLFVALFTMVSIGSLQQVSLHVLLQRLQEVLVIADVYIECCERLLSLVSVNDQKVTIKHLTYTSKDISIKFQVIHISQIIPGSITDLWGQSLQIFWSAKDPPMTLDKTGGCPRAFKASSKLSTKLLKNSNASCCSRRLTGSPHNLWRWQNIVKPDL